MTDIPDRPPSPLHVSAMSGVCRDTVNGWLWYCDIHDTHGNADFEEEARACAEAHRMALRKAEGRGGEGCDMVVWHRAENADDDG